MTTRLPTLLLLSLLVVASLAHPPIAGADTGPPRPPGAGSPRAGASGEKATVATETAPTAPTDDQGAAPAPTEDGGDAKRADGGEAEETGPTTPGLVEAQTACGGQPIATAELLGCVGTRCQNKQDREKLLSLTDLLPGRTLGPNALQLAVQRLEATGFFRVQKVRCLSRPSGARIAITVLGNQFVRSIELRGNREVLESELRNKLVLQPGDVLNPDTDDGRALLARQKAAFETLYQREGFESAKVVLVAKTFGVGLVGVEIDIVEGAKQHVAAIRTRILDPHRPTQQEAAAGLRCARVSERMIQRASGLADVSVFTRRAGVKSRTKVRGVLRRLGYHSPKVTITHDARQQVVDVEVRLGRCSVVRLLSRESSDQVGREATYGTVEDPDLIEAMPFGESGVFDLSEAERGRRELAALLENRGFLFADVELDFREVPRTWGSRVASAITYRLTTNYGAQIRGLRFCDGDVLADAEARGETEACAGRAGEALSFEEDELLKAIETRPYDVLDEGGYLATAQMFGDLDRLRQFYRDAGYFEFRYSLLAPAGGSGIVRRRRRTDTEEIVEYLLPDRGFRVRRPIGEHFIYVEVPFEEGRRSHLSEVRVLGADTAGEARIRGLFGQNRGDVASFTRVIDGLRRIEDDYRDRGYFQAHFEVLCATKNRAISAGGGKGLAPCTSERILAEQVELELRIREGPRVRIGEIFVNGNFRTDRELLLRDMPPEGSDFSSGRLFDSLRALRNLGLFRSVSFRYIGRDEQPVRDRIAIVVTVVEEQSRYFEAALGFQTVNVNRAQDAGSNSTPTGFIDLLEHQTSAGGRMGSGFGQRLGVSLPNLLLTAEASLLDRNLFGEGKWGRIVTRVGVTPNIFQTGTPNLLLAALEYQDRRFLGSETALRVVAPYFSRDFATTTIDIDKVGAAAEITRRFGRLGLSLGTDGGLVDFKDSSGVDFTGWLWQIKVVPRVSFDALDSPINPTRGVYGTTSVALINALIEPDATLGTTGGFATFAKFEAQAKAYTTIRDTLTLGMMVRVGWATSLSADADADALPGNERFRLGGQLGLRGFTDGGIKVYDANGAPVPVRQAVCSQVDTAGNCIGEWSQEMVCAELAADGSSCQTYATEDNGAVILNGSLEARFPILRTRGVWGALFWDWGAIAGGVDSIHVASFRHGVGFGLRYLVSGQIPVRLDYGVAVDRRCLTAIPFDGRSTCPEQEGFGQLQAGLLYAF
ncbi:MAG: hypothetical protein RIT45_241 [Pseudomonadota bacterium]|jgi:outer membrane protein assembly factor BamA